MRKPKPANALDYAEALSKLSKINQGHLLDWWKELDPVQQAHLLAQISALDLPALQQQQLVLRNARQQACPAFNPLTGYAYAGDREAKAEGLRLLAEGKAGCLIAAGGQGTRLKFDGPKGMFPVSIIQKKSLFQLFAEKTLAAGLQAGRKLPLAIMTSAQNDRQTRDFFEHNRYFGLYPGQVRFFVQKDLPLLSEKGNLFLEEKGSIAEGPDGNGSALSGLAESGIWSDWHAQGVRCLSFVLIDNPLADPFDSELIGYHHLKKTQATVKCTPRAEPDEKTGILVERNGRVEVVEYTEFPEQERLARGVDGSLRHLCANLSLFCFDMDFIKTVSGKESLPLHLAHKAVKYLDTAGSQVLAEKPMAWKFERFIFDVLPLADKIEALLYPREVCYAPLKNYDGENSLASVQAALLARDRAVAASVTGLPAPQGPFELAQEFHYPSQVLLKKWKGKSIPANGYISP